MTEAVWIVVQDGPLPLLAFSPEHLVGVSPCGAGIPGVVWWRVTPEGSILKEISEPDKSCPVDLILFRLAQAYTALMIAGNVLSPPPWKA